MNTLSCLQTIRARYDALTTVEKRIADYILLHEAEIPNLSTSELADRARTAKSAIVRCCKSLGFSGYPQLKLALAAELSKNRQLNCAPYISPEDTAAEIMEKVFSANVKALHDTAEQLDPRRIEQILEQLSKARHICLYGVGTSASMVAELQYRLMQLGYDAFGVEVLRQAGSSVEVFYEDPLNAPYAGFKRAGFWGGYGQGGGDVRVTKARALSSVPGDDTLAGTAVYETPQGGRICVQTRAPWADDIMGFAKSTQILNILDWMCDTVPVRIDTDCRVGQALWQGEKDLVCFLFSMDHDPAEKVMLRLKTPAGAERLMPDGSWQPIGEGECITVDRIAPFTCTAVRLMPLAE